MNAFTARARSMKSSGRLPATAPKRRNLALSPSLALALVTVTLVSAGSCTKKALVQLGLLKPAITNESPNSVAAGSPDVLVTLTGVNFGNSPFILFDGKLLTITSATDTEIQFTIPSSVLTTPGTHTVVVGAALPDTTLFSNMESFVVTSATGGTPVLGIVKSHTGSFMQGETGATYMLMVSNTGSAPTSGTVTVTDMLPSGLTVTSLDGGSTWTCNTTMQVCDRNDPLNGGSAYPPIILTVNVATNAPSMVTNEATVSGGGSSPATAMDPTTINSGGGTASLTLSITHSPTTFSHGGTGIHTITVGNNGTIATGGTVSVDTTRDPDETVVSVNGGSFFNCMIGSSGDPSCTSIGNLAAGGTAQITVNVTLGPTFTGTITFQAVANALGTSGASASDMVQVQ